MNLVPAIYKMENAISDLKIEYNEKIKELTDGLEALRKINTTCEKCNGEGSYLRPRACAEDDRPDPDEPSDYIKCDSCHGTGKAKYNTQ